MASLGDLKRGIKLKGVLPNQVISVVDVKLRFEILTRDTYDAAVSGNAFLEHDLAIMRLDQVARDDDLKDRLRWSSTIA